jgi:hypothetical protein
VAGCPAGCDIIAFHDGHEEYEDIFFESFVPFVVFWRRAELPLGRTNMSDSSPVEGSQADQAVVVPDERPTRGHWKALGLLVAANAIFGAYFNPMGASENQVGEIAAYAAIGFLVTQPVLFALWAAFAPHRFYRRFLWALLACSSVAFIEELGAVRHSQSGLGETMALQLALFILFTAILLLVRRYVGWRFEGSQPAVVAGDYQAYQFGMVLLTNSIQTEEVQGG